MYKLGLFGVGLFLPPYNLATTKSLRTNSISILLIQNSLNYCDKFTLNNFPYEVVEEIMYAILKAKVDEIHGITIHDLFPFLTIPMELF